MSKQSEFLVFNIESDEITSILSSPVRNIVVPAASKSNNLLRASLPPPPRPPARHSRSRPGRRARCRSRPRRLSLSPRAARPGRPLPLWRAPRGFAVARTPPRRRDADARLLPPPAPAPPRASPDVRLGRRDSTLVEEPRRAAGAALHVVAGGGGVDSSLAAYLVHGPSGRMMRSPPPPRPRVRPGVPSPAQIVCRRRRREPRAPRLAARDGAPDREPRRHPPVGGADERGVRVAARVPARQRGRRVPPLQAHPLRDPRGGGAKDSTSERKARPAASAKRSDPLVLNPNTNPNAKPVPRP